MLVMLVSPVKHLQHLWLQGGGTTTLSTTITTGLMVEMAASLADSASSLSQVNTCLLSARLHMEMDAGVMHAEGGEGAHGAADDVLLCLKVSYTLE